MMTAATYGMYSAAVSIAITLIEYFTGLDKSPNGRWIGFLGFIFLIIFIYLAEKARKEEELNGQMTYGQGVGTGTIVALVSSSILCIFMYIYMTYINPELIDYIVAEQQKQFAAQHMSAEQQATATRMLRMFSGSAWQSVMVLVGGTLIGVVISLIVSIFVKTKEEDLVQVS